MLARVVRVITRQSPFRILGNPTPSALRLPDLSARRTAHTRSPSRRRHQTPNMPSMNRDDAITAEEITGVAPPNEPDPKTDASSQKRPNAFTEIMSSSKKPKAPAQPLSTLDKAKKIARGFDPRDGLGVYIDHPETNPEGRVVDYDDDFVVINDKYPKASVHLLLIPRNPAYYFQHPLELLSKDAGFLTDVQERVARLKTLAATELRRQYGRLSAADAPYQTALEEIMSSPSPPSPSKRASLLPPGRDWLADIKAGVHTHPSMNHLHIHILSRDMQSPCLKHKKHYLSFTTGFLVEMDEFPLEEGSKRFHPGNWPAWEMTCWRCGKGFGNKFAKLKEHIGEEFEVWKRE